MKVIALFILIFSGFATANDKPIRIITLAPHLTEMVFSAGAGDLLVGVVKNSDYPQQAKKLPIIGQHKNVNFEAIIKLNPTLIISWKHSSSAQEIANLKRLGIEVWQTEIKHLTDIPKQIKAIGKKTKRVNIANQEANKLNKILNQLSLSQKKISPELKTKVFYQVWGSPLYTVGKNQFITQAIELCDATNIFGKHPLPAPEVNIESIIKENPDLIILGGNKDRQNQWHKNWLQYPIINAVKNKQIIKIDNSVYQRPTARFIKAIPSLCKNIYPKLHY